MVRLSHASHTHVRLSHIVCLGWKCQPRDCTYCSVGINGFPCGGDNCTTCIRGINGWLCQPAAAVTLCTLGFTDASGWSVSAQYRVEEQNDVGFAKLFVSSSQRLTGIELRTGTTNEVAWAAWPETAADIGNPIFWLRKPALRLFSYPSATASRTAFSPADGRRAPEFIIPALSTGLTLWLQREGETEFSPAPGPGLNAFSCQLSTDFQADVLAGQ